MCCTAFTNLVLHAIGLSYQSEQHVVHTPDELRLLIRRSRLSAEERQLLDRAFAFTEFTAAEVMVPRTEVIGIAVDTPLDEVVKIVRRLRHTRFPVYEGSIDNVVGVVSAKDVLNATRDGELRRLMRPPLLVPISAEASEVLARMRAARQPLAVVLDEYGGTAGILTLKKLVQWLFGDVDDETAAPLGELRDGSLVANGLV